MFDGRHHAHLRALGERGDRVAVAHVAQQRVVARAQAAAAAGERRVQLEEARRWRRRRGPRGCRRSRRRRRPRGSSRSRCRCRFAWNGWKVALMTYSASADRQPAPGRRRSGGASARAVRRGAVRAADASGRGAGGGGGGRSCTAVIVRAGSGSPAPARGSGTSGSSGGSVSSNTSGGGAGCERRAARSAAARARSSAVLSDESRLPLNGHQAVCRSSASSNRWTGRPSSPGTTLRVPTTGTIRPWPCMYVL